MRPTLMERNPDIAEGKRGAPRSRPAPFGRLATSPRSSSTSRVDLAGRADLRFIGHFRPWKARHFIAHFQFQAVPGCGPFQIHRSPCKYPRGTTPHDGVQSLRLESHRLWEFFFLTSGMEEGH